jgi:DNA-binding MarR family transcriptional regulator
LTGIVDRLEARRLLVRKIHPQDRRSYLLEMTPKGRKLGHAALRALSDLEASAVQGVPEHLTTRLLEVLEALSSAVSTDERPGRRPARLKAAPPRR